MSNKTPVDQRRQAWRVVELAAKIAQEDEAAAATLFLTAGGMFQSVEYAERFAGWDLGNRLSACARDFSYAIPKQIECDARQTLFPVAKDSDDE